MLLGVYDRGYEPVTALDRRMRAPAHVSLSLPTFVIALTVLLFTVLEEAAACCTSIVTLIGLGLMARSTFYFFREFRWVMVIGRAHAWWRRVQILSRAERSLLNQMFYVSFCSVKLFCRCGITGY